MDSCNCTCRVFCCELVLLEGASLREVSAVGATGSQRGRLLSVETKRIYMILNWQDQVLGSFAENVVF